MKVIDEAKVKEIIVKLRSRRGMLQNLKHKRQREGTAEGIQSDIDDISRLITVLEKLPDFPSEDWTLNIQEGDKNGKAR